jgi:hypothetical protein
MQTPEDKRDVGNQDLDAPPELIAALKRSSQRPFFIPPTVDEAILDSARRHLAPRKARGFKWLLVMRWGGAVAALVALLAILPRFVQRAGSGSNVVAVPGDLNHDGHVDILDAFALARELKSGAQPAASRDINGDGVVDERDVAALAARAVSLGKGGRS